MALDKVLIIYDEHGNPVDYDILAKDVKFQPDGKDLPTKLAEMEQEIGEAGQVNEIIMNGQTYTPTNKVIDLGTVITQHQDISGKVDKETGKGLSTEDFTAALKAKLEGLDPYTKAQVDALIAAASSGAVSVTSNGDGTFTIHVGDTDYTINLNHTHENMAKLVVCEESDLPSTLDNSTIYAITDSGETEIEKLIIRGMEFTGGGVPDTGEPMISSPSNGSTINLGTNEGSGVSKTITVKGKNLTGDLTVAVGTGLTISYGQSTGQSSVTIPMAQALLGAQVTIAYSGSGALADGSLVISHGNDVLSSVVVVVVEAAPVSLAAVKLTGTQWLQTDYCPNANTELEMELKFDSVTTFQTGKSIFLSCAKDGNYRWFFFNGTESGVKYQVAVQPETSSVATINYQSNQAAMLADHSILKYYKDGANAKLSFLSGGVTEQTTNAAVKTTTMAQPMAIGYSHLNNEPYANFELTIYRLTIKENGVTVRNYLPKRYRGVPGLYDTVSDTFISSETSSELVAIEIS